MKRVLPRLKKSLKKLLAIVLILLLGTGIWMKYFAHGAEAAWFDESWAYRTALQFTNSGSSVTYQKVKFDIDTATLISAGKLQSDCGDSRFTDANGKLLQYYLANPGGTDNCNQSSTDYYVLLPTIPAGSNIVYHYYGNPQASNGTVATQFSQTTFTTGSVTPASEEQAPQPAAYWKFDEGAGTTANDSTINKNTGTLAGATLPTWQSSGQCVSKNCLYFNGATSQVTIANTISNVKTISFWVKSATASAALVKLTTTADIRANSGVIETSQITSPTVYVNGKQTTSYSANTWNYVTITTASGISANSIVLGKSLLGNLNGYLDEVKFYPYVRSASQVAADYNAGINLGGNVLGSATQKFLSDGLISYWKMDEYSGTSAADASGNSNTGTLTSMQETGTADASGGSTTTLVDTTSSSLSSTDSVYVGMWLVISSTCNATNTTGLYRQITAYAGSTKTITVISAFPATLNSCQYEIRHTVAGRFNQGLIFDGIDDSVPTGQGVLNGLSNLTIAFWAKGTGNPWGQGDGTTSSFMESNRILFRTAAGLLDWTISDPFDAAAWHHYVVTKSGDTLALYKDGVLSQGPQTFKFSGAITAAATNNFTFGKVPAGTGGAAAYFSGAMDDFRVYNRAMPATEIASLYAWGPAPVGYYDFEDQPTTTILDKSGTGNNLTLQGGMSLGNWTSGKYGKGMSFDGIGNYLQATSPTWQNKLQSYTISTWINANVMNGASEISRLWSRMNGDSNYPRMRFFGSGDTQLQYAVNGGTGNINLDGNTDGPPPAIWQQSWHYVTVTRDGVTGVNNIYVDGRLYDSTTVAGTLTGGANNPIIGSQGGSSLFFNGKMDDFKIYDYARTPKQVLEDMNGTHPAGGNGTGSQVAYWKLNEGYGTTANDSATTNSAENLTLSAVSWTSNGKLGKAFDGGDNKRMSLSDDNDLDFTAAENFSVSLWFKSDAAANPAATQYLLSKGPTSAAGYAIYANTSGQICFGIDDDTTWNPDIASCTTTSYYDAAWHHVVGIRDATTHTDKLYVDGVLKDTDTDTTAATLANSASFYIGDTNATDGTDEFLGDIDEVKIYRANLSESEVKKDMNSASQVLGSAGNNSNYAVGAANQEYCVPGDSTSCAAPVGEWKFEEGTGTSGQDSSGNNNTATHAGKYVTGKLGKALSFSGAASERANAGSAAGLDQLSALSASGWIKLNALPVTQSRILIAKVANTSPTNGWYLGIGSSGGIEFEAEYAGNDLWHTSANGVIELGKWYFIEATWDGSATATNVHIYLNGAEVSYSAAQNGTSTRQSDASQNLVIGGSHDGTNGGTSETPDGTIDQVRLFNYVRTPSQVAWDYNKGAPVGWWKMDECQGANVYDSSGNGNTGTITLGSGGTTSVGSCQSGSGARGNGVSGKVNSSLSFDGTDDYVPLSNSSLLSPGSGNMTISAWVNTSVLNSATHDIYRDYGTNSNNLVALSIDTSNHFTAAFRDIDGDVIAPTSTRSLSTGTWYHVVAIKQGTTGYLYVNGVLDATNTNGSTGSVDVATDDPPTIGAWNEGGIQNLWWNGKLDEIKIFNYAVTGTQVKTLYNGGAVRFGPLTGTP